VRWVHDLFPDRKDYLDVYGHHGLLGKRTLLAHGVHMNHAEFERCAASGAALAHCPTSNLFLGSGLLDWRRLEAAGARVSIATDVGGGTSLSMLRTLAEAYKVQALQGSRLTAWKALYTATRGAARALGLEHEIGSLDIGSTADIAVWNYAASPLARHRDALARSLHERLFAFMTLGDERNLESVLVAGTPHVRAASG